MDAVREKVIPDRIYVVGHSLGGAVSLYALQNEKRVKGLVLWSVPKDHDYNVRKFIKNRRGNFRLQLFLALAKVDSFLGIGRLLKMEVYGIELRPKYLREKMMLMNECEAASKLRGIPLLVINGQRDEIVSVDEAEAVFESANEPKYLSVIESADHVFRNKEDEVIQKTLNWIKNLNQQQPKKSF